MEGEFKMEKNNIHILKRLTVVVMALALVLTTVLIPTTVKAATTDSFVVKQYTLAKGEKWTLNVYDAADNAKISYKSSKSSVASVNKNGVVTAKKKGTAVITVTIKEGKNTYKAKTKITVKAKITALEAVKRVNAELNLLYVYAYELAEMNGWLDNEEAVDYLVACADVVDTANDVVANPKSYTDDDIDDVLDAIEAMADTMDELLPVLASPCE